MDSLHEQSALRLPELLLPAGSVAKLQMALRYGADAVYVGAAGLSMRPDSVSFSVEDLRRGLKIAHGMGRRLYVAINSLLFDDDMPALERWLEDTREIPIDAAIVADLGALALVRQLRPEVSIHVSTQLSTANVRAARLLKELGAARVILARECTLEQVTSIAAPRDVEVEVFVHGAMCMAISGRCLLSAHLCGKSGSTGGCKHSCRWEWQLVEKKRAGEAMPVFEVGRQTIFLGSKDLCLIEHIPELVRSGVSSLKVEGRMKSEYYVAAVARAYRAALDAYGEDPEGYQLDQRWLQELGSVSHRPYDVGFAFGYPSHDPGRLQTHNRPVSSCQVVAYVRGVDTESPSGHRLEVKNPFREGETLEWIGPSTAGGEVTIEAMVDDQGNAIDRTISATLVSATLSGPLPEHAILRRRADS